MRYTFSKSLILASAFVVTGLVNSCSSTDEDNNEISEAVEEEVQLVEEGTEEANPLSEISADSTDNVNDSENNNEEIAESYQDISGSDESPASPIDAELDTLASSPLEEGGTPDLVVPVSDTKADMPKARKPSDAMASGYGEYIVQPGDTLSKIAYNIFGSRSKWSELAAENEIVNPERILPGDVIKYQVTDSSKDYMKQNESLATSTVTVEKGDTLSKIATRLFGSSSYWRSIWRLNQAEIPNPHRLRVGQELKYIEPNKYRSAFKSTGSTKVGH